MRVHLRPAKPVSDEGAERLADDIEDEEANDEQKDAPEEVQTPLLSEKGLLNSIQVLCSHKHEPLFKLELL